MCVLYRLAILFARGYCTKTFNKEIKLALTQRQADVLAYIKKHLKASDVPPTMREISEHFGWASHNSAQHHLMALHAAGAVRKTNRGYVPA